MRCVQFSPFAKGSKYKGGTGEGKDKAIDNGFGNTEIHAQAYEGSDQSGDTHL